MAITARPTPRRRISIGAISRSQIAAPAATVSTRPPRAASGYGQFSVISQAQVMPPSMTNEPCAKFRTPVVR